MDYRVIIDSCGELTGQMKASGQYQSVPLTMEVDGRQIIDDDTFDQAAFLKIVRESSQGPKSSCPSPDLFRKACQGDAKRIYMVTLSAELSGSYNSARLGRQLFLEGCPEKEIHVFNSCSASVGETLIALKIAACEQRGMSFSEVISTVDAYIEEQRTFFVLETLETLRKNGRLTGAKALLASALNIKPVMGATQEGAICQLGQARGMRQALKKLSTEVLSTLTNSQDKILGIAHCHCLERAEQLKTMLLSMAAFQEVILLDTAGISSMYASEGGIIVVV